MELKWTILVFLAAVLSLCDCLNWMAGGTFTQADFAVLRAKVDAFDASDRKTYAAFATAMSNQLNELWHPAWNVVTFFISAQGDTVMYGYAFNGHWFWQNGIKAGNYYASIVIWKDYNCVMWTTYNPSGSQYSSDSTMGTIIANKIQSQNSGTNRDLDDIWNVAADIQEKVITADPTLLQDKTAYTVIASQISYSYVYGRFCAHSFTYVVNIGKQGTMISGTAFILQMRAS